MITRMYVLHDLVTDTYATPVCCISDAQVLRELRLTLGLDELQSTPMCRCPSDYDLLYVGDYDDSTGVLVPADHIKLVNLGALSPIVQEANYAD